LLTDMAQALKLTYNMTNYNIMFTSSR
jgi:hypothetical protein